MTQHRLRAGFGYGVVATIAMSILMLLALISGNSPMPQPIPKAVVAHLFRSGLPKPMLMLLAVGLHLGYGGVFGALLARVARPVTIGKGLAFGVGLWVLMQVAFLPFLGWGLFGMAITPKIAVATLVLHLVYGGVLGWALDRHTVSTSGESVTTAD
ncbi:DUF6789 family protein [Halogeometricum luteum]|uniref:DUF1440 domain-containing protein n=1 Tax=Halogeometricum luteum TaxID=2950537 RepID=A0ABU2G7B5_9EURY|nr:DUF6789 family protein [Halogeometricum sp. S3BR5-2]MDS0296686.1 hypothetical protein [Halogeometricum sp. S3BR5-2]